MQHREEQGCLELLKGLYIFNKRTLQCGEQMTQKMARYERANTVLNWPYSYIHSSTQLPLLATVRGNNNELNELRKLFLSPANKFLCSFIILDFYLSQGN